MEIQRQLLHAQKELMKILLAIDGSKFSEAAARLLAKQFRHDGDEVRVLSVVEPVVTAAVPQMASGYHPELQDEKNEARALVECTAKMLSDAGFRVATLVLVGDAKSVILDEAADWSADLIVLGSHGRKGLGRFLLGSVSDAVARHSTCSVEIVRMRQ